MADGVKEPLFWKQAANPLYYIIITLAFLIRTPFLVLQQAGLPKVVEYTLWGQAAKAVLLVILAFIFVHYGLKFKLSDLIGFLK
jgi:type VI protein secretion system component VasF